MQGTESNELGAVACRPAAPILLSQVIEQRKSLFESFEILAHGCVLAPGDERRGSQRAFPGKDGGHKEKFFRAVGARGSAEPELARDRPDLGAPANERRAFRKKERAGWEESRPRDQRRSVPVSGTRLGSLSAGVPSSLPGAMLVSFRQGCMTRVDGSCERWSFARQGRVNVVRSNSVHGA